MKAILKFYKKTLVKLIRARQRRAAEDMATMLIKTNNDFRGMSHSDLSKAIMCKGPVRLSEISL